MVDDWVIKTMYATKRRRKNPKSNKPSCSAIIRSDQNVKSNPSKRHRERLNSELEHLASLLPFEQNVIVKLDKLSILRLAVSYLRIKCYFHALSFDRLITENRLVSHLYHCPFDLTRIEGEACLQALNGFIFIMSCDGEVFSVSRTVEHYLGFHQADILHQSVLELIHSEDREEFRRQLSWRSLLPPELHSSTLHDLMNPENAHYLKRQFTVRFRCLLDNTSGFITLELSGRLQFLHGQARSMQLAVNSGQMNSCTNSNLSNKYNTSCSYTVSNSSQHILPPLGLFAVCSPLGPLPSLNGPQRDSTFKTKHQLDLTVITIDARARLIFNYSDSDLQHFKVYDLVHPDDLRYVARGHKELFKVGSLGLLVHRWLNKQSQWIWLQSRIKLIMKNGKQDHIIVIHRQLSNEEGMELLIRRTDEYKLPFPLLEPETLMNGEELTTANTSLHMSTNSTFPTGHIKNFDHHHMTENNDHKLYVTNIKSDNKIILGPKNTAEHFSSFDISSNGVGFNLKRAHSRYSTDLAANSTQMERCIARPTSDNYNDNLHLSGLDTNLLDQCVIKPSKQSKVISANGLRRKRTIKETTKSEVNKCKLNHRGSCTTACTYMSNAQAGCQINYGTNICPSAYFPLGFNQALSRDGDSVYRNPYLHWPTDINTTGSSENRNLNRSDNSERLPHYDPGKVSLFMINSHNSNQELHEFNMPDHCRTRNYPTAYDAYSAAVAAAAVVAAATNNCNQRQLNQSHHSLSLHQQYLSQQTLDQEIKHYKRHGLNSSHILTNTNELDAHHFQQSVNNSSIFDLHRRQQHSQLEYNSLLLNQQAALNSNLQSSLANCTDYILSNNYFSHEQSDNNQSLSKDYTRSNEPYIKEFLKPTLSDTVNSLHHPQMEAEYVKRNNPGINNHNNGNELGQSLSSYTPTNANHIFPDDDYRTESTYEQKDTATNTYLQHSVEQRIMYANPVIDKESSSTYSSYSSPPNLVSPHNNEIGLDSDSGVSQHQHRQVPASLIVEINNQFTGQINSSLGSSKCPQFYDSKCPSGNWIMNPTQADYNQTAEYLSDEHMAELDCGNYHCNRRVLSISASMDSSNSSRSPTPHDTCVSQQDDKLPKTGTENDVLYSHKVNKSASGSCRLQSKDNSRVKISSFSAIDFDDQKQDFLNSRIIGNKLSIAGWDDHNYDNSKSTAIPVPVVCSGSLKSVPEELSQTNSVNASGIHREELLTTI
ncbi:Aryl hydrocarbon receptor [Schistosoma japonicum]|nr:Aryl hydrocarbon receptor [Schistosoma japonicum]